MPGLKKLDQNHIRFLGEKGTEHVSSRQHLSLLGTQYIQSLFSKDSCVAGVGELLIGTTAFFITRSLLMAKNRPLLLTEQVGEALETIALNCVIKGCIITYMNKAERSKLRKKHYVSELLFFTLPPIELSFKVVK